MIPARSGSKGLPDKNIMDVAGHPLLAHAIDFGKRLSVERVIVSTDSERYREIALSYGASAPFLRGEEASSDTAMEELVVGDAVKQMGDQPDVWVWLKPTSPFRSVAQVRKALMVMDRFAEVDSVRIVSQADARVQYIDADHWLKPYASDWPQGRSKIRRTELMQVFKPFNLEVFRHLTWLARGADFMGEHIRAQIDHPVTGLDIDDQQTFDICKALIEADPPSLRDYISHPRYSASQPTHKEKFQRPGEDE